MSDIMRPMPFAHLMNWILGEYRTTQSIFGVSKLVRRGDGKAPHNTEVRGRRPRSDQ